MPFNFLVVKVEDVSSMASLAYWPTMSLYLASNTLACSTYRLAGSLNDLQLVMMICKSSKNPEMDRYLRREEEGEGEGEGEEKRKEKEKKSRRRRKACQLNKRRKKKKEKKRKR